MEPEDAKQPGADPPDNANQPAEAEKAFAEARGKYDTSIDRPDVVLIGGSDAEIKIIHNNNIGMGLADYKDLARDTAQDVLKSNVTNVARTVADMVKQELAEAWRADRQEGLFLNTSPAGTWVPPADIPLERQGISDWFYALEEQKQYIVQAIALLHGAKTQEIEQLREELYLPVKKEREQYLASLQKDQASESSSPPYPERLQPSERVYEHTYAEFRSVYGTERLFWQDTDKYGISAFSLQILLFLARDAARGSWGVKGKNFLEAAERWTATTRGDCYWRAARASGIIWRSRDKERVQILAEAWASTPSQRSWRKVASLLEGAYAFECQEEGWKQDDPLAHSFVLAILNQWIGRAHTATKNVSVWVGCAAAYTYGLLGKTYPRLALDGLDRLLAFPVNQGSQGIPVRLFAAGVSNYVALTWAGHLQAVLARLAMHAEKFTHRRRFFSMGTSESVRYRLQRQLTLEVVFNIFFMILITSLPPNSNDICAEYSLTASIEELIQIDGLDTVLAGVLTTHASGWRNEVVTLCCAALCDEQQKITLVFEFIQQWVLLILKAQKDELRCSLVEFFVILYRTLNVWSQDLLQAGFRNQAAPEAFKRHLGRWTQLRSPISDFAQEVQRSLEC